MSVSMNLPFLDLPVEIRVTIYKLCLGRADLYIEDTGIDTKKSKGQGMILRTCKTIYSEAMPILYTNTAVTYVGIKKGPNSINLIPAYQKFIPAIILKNNFRSPVPLSMKILRNYDTLIYLTIYMGRLKCIVSHEELMRLVSEGKDDLIIKNIEKGLEVRGLENPPWVKRHYSDSAIGAVHFSDLKTLAQSKGRRFNICLVVEDLIFPRDVDFALLVGQFIPVCKAISDGLQANTIRLG